MPVTRGTPVTLCIGAANRDPEQCEAADRFDIARQPNRHLAFGFGIHQCAGLSLARLEARIAIGRFVRRFPAYRLDGEPTRGGRVLFRGFAPVPVGLEPASAGFRSARSSHNLTDPESPSLFPNH